MLKDILSSCAVAIAAFAAAHSVLAGTIALCVLWTLYRGHRQSGIDFAIERGKQDAKVIMERDTLRGFVELLADHRATEEDGDWLMDIDDLDDDPDDEGHDPGCIACSAQRLLEHIDKVSDLDIGRELDNDRRLEAAVAGQAFN